MSAASAVTGVTRDRDPRLPLATTLAPARERWSWALYDFAHTIFSMNVTTLYFAVWLVADLNASNTAVATANGIASALVMISIPVLGAFSDVTRRRKPWIVAFTLLAVAATIGLGAAGELLIPHVGYAVLEPAPITRYVVSGLPLVTVIAIFIVADYAYQATLPFYNAMMPELAPPDRWGRLSALGAVLGYTGSIVGVLMITPFFNGTVPLLGQLPHGFLNVLRAVFPFTSTGGRIATFAPTGILYLLFSLPIFLFCKDRFAVSEKMRVPWKNSFREVREILRDASQYPGVPRFIIASFVYQDAMGTIIGYMALYAVVAMGFRKGSETTLFIVLTIPAVFGSWVWGRLTDTIGPKRTLLGILVAWIVLLFAMILAPSRSAFWVVGAFIGFIYGGVSVAERPMLLRLIPEEEAGRFFGLMVLSARAAAVLGPFVWGATVDLLTPHVGQHIAYRAAVGSVALAMAIAVLILLPLPEPSSVALAQADLNQT